MEPTTQVALESGAESLVAAFGKQAQLIKACEEMAELTQKLCKYANGIAVVTDEEIVDEIADVLICTYQMRSLFGKGAVDERIIFKLNRTMEFIRNNASRFKERPTT